MWPYHNSDSTPWLTHLTTIAIYCNYFKIPIFYSQWPLNSMLNCLPTSSLKHHRWGQSIFNQAITLPSELLPELSMPILFEYSNISLSFLQAVKLDQSFVSLIGSSGYLDCKYRFLNRKWRQTLLYRSGAFYYQTNQQIKWVK